MNYQLLNVFFWFTISFTFLHPCSKQVDICSCAIGGNDSIPQWAKQLYLVDTAENGYPRTNIIFFAELTDSTSYVIVEYDYATGVRTDLATQKKREHFKNMVIGREEDSELSGPIYSTVTYRHDSSRKTIVVTIDEEIAKSKFTIKKNGRLVFKHGYSIGNAETYHQVTKKTIKILRSGDVKLLK